MLPFEPPQTGALGLTDVWDKKSKQSLQSKIIDSKMF